MIREAQYYSKLDNRCVRCRLCPAECRLKPDQRGICYGRFNDGGTLMTDNFGETVTVAIDPIEKKPLYHFRPGSDIVSIGPNGCNLSCGHCQNWAISQEHSSTVYIAPEELARLGSREDSVGVAYTYTEPIIWFEYIMEAAPLVRQAGLVNVLVSNGYINPEPLREILPLIDACNIDLKSMRPEFYKRVCKGRLEPVLETIALIAASKTHIELTNLIIPGHNDEERDFHAIGEFVARIDPLMPVHLSAYHPSYRMKAPATPGRTLKKAHAILRQYARDVFAGNMYIEGCSDSYCHACGRVLIARAGYNITMEGLSPQGNCRVCGTASTVVLGRPDETS